MRLYSRLLGDRTTVSPSRVLRHVARKVSGFCGPATNTTSVACRVISILVICDLFDVPLVVCMIDTGQKPIQDLRHYSLLNGELLVNVYGSV